MIFQLLFTELKSINSDNVINVADYKFSNYERRTT